MQACPCKLCNGALRDRRTIRAHLSSPYHFKKQDQGENYPEKERNDDLLRGEETLRLLVSNAHHDEQSLKTRNTDFTDKITKQPCFCKECQGLLRDARTVKLHSGRCVLHEGTSSNDFEQIFVVHHKIVVPSRSNEDSANQAYTIDGNSGIARCDSGNCDDASGGLDDGDNGNDGLDNDDDDDDDDECSELDDDVDDGDDDNSGLDDDDDDDSSGLDDGDNGNDGLDNDDECSELDDGDDDDDDNSGLDDDDDDSSGLDDDAFDPEYDDNVGNAPGYNDNEPDADLDHLQPGFEPPNPELPGPEPDPERDNIKKAILRVLQIKVNHGSSQEETMQHLRNLYEYTHDERVPHSSWHSVVEYLKVLGYKDATCHKVCFSEDHVVLLDDNEDCPVCGKAQSKCVNYYVLGLQLENIFASPEQITKHLKHWLNRDNWYNVDVVNVNRKETWDGERFAELSYFWDRNASTLLPIICPNCDEIISKTTIERARPNGMPHTQEFVMTCGDCAHAFLFKPTFMTGSPLNQAYIMHEDGFNAFFTSSRGTAAIHISNACAEKQDRGKKEFVQVYSFIPTTHINEGIPNKLDAFFKPLIEEIKELYIKGKTIALEQPLVIGNDVIAAGNHQVRALIILGTADIKAHAQMLLYASGMYDLLYCRN